ncbi:MAG: 4'-phosphopantetheinyl transferase superfamily protein [Bacteroidia bacterium]|nr:4'-phosphopantetheinyl transferase superfamily protein [Bacteroidia bacterium]MDW8301371.1 4'-phosphopantetheinyl transferase superfamily protein [Bacteroidia bacterium]
MPYIPVVTSDASIRIGLWHTLETEQELYRLLTLTEREELSLSKCVNPKRRLQWLSSRCCLKETLCSQQFVEMLADENGKPYIYPPTHHISVSHSKDMSAAIVCGTYDVGIDIQEMRIISLDLAKKYMSECELLEENEKHKYFIRNVVWSAKEAAYKCRGKKDVYLKENIRVLNIRTLMEDDAANIVIYPPDGEPLFYIVEYAFYKNYVYAYCVASSNLDIG